MTKSLSHILILLFLPFGISAQNSHIDSLKSELFLSKQNNQRIGIALQIAEAYLWDKIDSSEVYVALAKRLSQAAENKELQAEIYLKESKVLLIKNKFEASLSASQKALNGFKKLGNSDGLGRTKNQIGDIYFRMGSAQNAVQLTRKALVYILEAIVDLKSVNNSEGLISSYRNAGKTYRNLSDFKNAEAFYLMGLSLAKKEGIENAEVGILYANMSQIRMEVYKDYEGAIALLHQAIEIYQRTGNTRSMEHANRNLAENYRLKKDFGKALDFAEKAVALAEGTKDAHELANAYDILFRVQQDMGLYREALLSFRKVKMAEDTAINMEISNRIAEMEAKYETVKKDAEIAVLHSKADYEKAKARGFAVALFLLAVIGLIVFISQSQKRKREGKIAEQEREIEQGKLESAKLELEFKQKELTGKILQLARKNEFLGSLEKEVETLKDNVDSSVNKASGKISRLIKNDVADDKQWEQFTTEFSSLHQGFLDALVAKHGSFTNSEFRLISLLKMNLSSKDIADTLHVSMDGIKKARYRLRKKLSLPSDEDLQAYLLSF